MNDDEIEEIRVQAAVLNLTVAEWVRQALRDARRAVPQGSRTKKLDAIRVAAVCAFPTAEMDQMLADIEKGYLGGEAP